MRNILLGLTLSLAACGVSDGTALADLSDDDA